MNLFFTKKSKSYIIGRQPNETYETIWNLNQVAADDDNIILYSDSDDDENENDADVLYLSS